LEIASWRSKNLMMNSYADERKYARVDCRLERKGKKKNISKEENNVYLITKDRLTEES
jgi:hypothetical protein